MLWTKKLIWMSTLQRSSNSPRLASTTGPAKRREPAGPNSSHYPLTTALRMAAFRTPMLISEHFELDAVPGNAGLLSSDIELWWICPVTKKLLDLPDIPSRLAAEFCARRAQVMVSGGSPRSCPNIRFEVVAANPHYFCGCRLQPAL